MAGYSEKFTYLHLGEEFDPKYHMFVTFYLESRDDDFERVAEGVAAESSVGTWTDVSTLQKDMFNRLSAKVYEIKKIDTHMGVIKVAYPTELFETDNIPQVLASVAGNVFGLKEIKNLRVKDIIFPEKYLKDNKGPAFGIAGIRDTLKVYDRPLVGTIIKPKLGLSSEDHAKVAYEAWMGGIDIVKDDENLSDQDFNPFYERITKTLDARRKAENETGERKMYCPNVSARVGEMYARAKFVREMGGKAVMVDIVTVGYSGVQFVRDQEMGLIMHGHRAMHGAFTNSDRHGISMLTIAKFARLAGIDQLHTGTVVGKMEGSREEVTRINDFMRKSWSNIKPTLPIASGGLHPGLVQDLVEILGKDIIINMGGGIHGHPDGTKAGAKAARHAVEMVAKGKTLKEAQESSPELKKVLDLWGIGAKQEDVKGHETFVTALVESKGLGVARE